MLHVLLWMTISAPASAPAVTSVQLDTPRYRIEIHPLCQTTAKGDTHRYRAHSKLSQEALTLTGQRWPKGCQADQCQGFQFTRRNVHYRVFDHGLLQVEQRGHLLVEEQGSWQATESTCE